MTNEEAEDRYVKALLIEAALKALASTKPTIEERAELLAWLPDWWGREPIAIDVCESPGAGMCVVPL